MTDGDSSRGTRAAGGCLHPRGERTLVKTGSVRNTRQLGGELRGVQRLQGSESTRSSSKPEGVGETGGGTTMDAR